ncbi:ferroptosis suppressor protein 1-like [Amphiura filiformis]|uniref:ferroptosis suppressor protein 1-like n=1 Tax=Amphiura filiformis TaxID=82378 RepID=UPI003B223CD7
MGSWYSSNLKEKHVVIVGGGYGGVAAANHLRGKCKLTLIDPKECMHHCVASLRAVVEPGYAKKIFIPYKPAFGESFKRGTVTEIDVATKKVVLDNGEAIHYDYLVIATGTTGGFPGKLGLDMKDVSRAVDMYNDMLQKIKAAESIVVIGGGPVGVELAGEIKTDLADKQVTLIHSKPALIDGPFTESFRKSTHDQLAALGVNVLLDQKVTNLKDLEDAGWARCTVETEKKNSIKADLVFLCVGMKTNTDAYENTLAEKMDDRGCLIVNEFLQVNGHENVFAIGDCSSADDEAKMGYTASLHAYTVAWNIQYLADGKSLTAYRPPGPLMVLPIGRNGGEMQYGTWVLGSFVARMIKSKDLFTRRFWGEMRQSVPM